ncbi:guanylate kinase [Catalinimonas alkaloidigena]|uniref:guanylate kinase n=1 Tax=Catalinimonas alkaloidigena TaxID=1075417 RepID=UPI002405F202|nr:guanylate kinase [Catalinimonas alkaloidigena]MDF9801064.1 guanylate kinase [Catalinimonas alkaloidigena]
MQEGKAFIFSAPSGSGKTTIVKHLLKYNSDLSFSISACTRSKRPSEVNGRDYYFMSPAEFRARIEEKAFIEWEEVYEGKYYGTLKSEIERIWQQGKHVVFDVDVLGGINLKKYFGSRALAVFVRVPSVEKLKERLASRNTESEESLEQRIAKAEEELQYEQYFDVTLVNDHLKDTLEQAQHFYEEFVQKGELTSSK